MQNNKHEQKQTLIQKLTANPKTAQTNQKKSSNR